MQITVIILMSVHNSNRMTTLWQPLKTSMTAPIKGIIKVAATTMDGKTIPTKVGEIILTRVGGTIITEEAEITMEIRGGITTITSGSRIRPTEHLI